MAVWERYVADQQPWRSLAYQKYAISRLLNGMETPSPRLPSETLSKLQSAPVKKVWQDVAHTPEPITLIKSSRTDKKRKWLDHASVIPSPMEPTPSPTALIALGNLASPSPAPPFSPNENASWGRGGGVPTRAPSRSWVWWSFTTKPVDSLGRSESNGVRVYLFRSTVDLPGQVKQRSSVSRGVNFVKFFVNNF